MKRLPLSARVVLFLLVGVLALPVAPIASPVAAKARPGMISRSFANPTFIDLPVGGGFPASASNLYPSTITVRGLKKSRIRDINGRLSNLEHLYPDDVQVLLVGPRGQTAIVMANTGGGFPLDDVTLMPDDEAAALLPDQHPLQSGSFRPIVALVAQGEGCAAALGYAVTERFGIPMPDGDPSPPPT